MATFHITTAIIHIEVATSCIEDVIVHEDDTTVHKKIVTSYIAPVIAQITPSTIHTVINVYATPGTTKTWYGL